MLKREGIFITFEGCEGAGKSTQIMLLEQKLCSQGQSVFVTREPGGTEVGNQIRSVLLDPELEPMERETEMLLYAASRAEIVRKKIIPALNTYDVVLCDRFVHSSYAYQSGGRGIDLEIVKSINKIALANIFPHLVILLDIDPSLGLKRASMNASLDRLEKADISFHRKVRSSFLDQAIQDPRLFRVIDATKSESKISNEVNLIIEELFLQLETLKLKR